MSNFYGGSQCEKETSQQQEQKKTGLEILNKIQEYSNEKSLQRKFGKLISTLLKDATLFSKDLFVEYHVVIFNKQLETRFTILESKSLVQRKKDEDSKANSFGAVGLLYDNLIQSNFLMIQFGYVGIDPIVYVNEEDEDQNSVSIRALYDDELENLWTPEAKKEFYWAVSGKPIPDSSTGQSKRGTEERKYAIAATIFFSDVLGGERDARKPLGAISLDFITKSKKYPHFAFRDNEISTVYRILQNIREVIELVIIGDTSNDLMAIIKLALGEEK